MMILWVIIGLMLGIGVASSLYARRHGKREASRGREPDDPWNDAAYPHERQPGDAESARGHDVRGYHEGDGAGGEEGGDFDVGSDGD